MAFKIQTYNATTVQYVDKLMLGQVAEEVWSYETGFMVLPLPGETLPFIFDFFGVTQTLVITGRKVDTITNLRTFKTDLEYLVNGQQSSYSATQTDGPEADGGYRYVSDAQSGNYSNMFIESAEIRFNEGLIKLSTIAQDAVEYTITMKKGTNKY